MSRVWSEYQLAVFEDARHGAGHTVVEAVPGSGKTTTGTEMLKYIPSGLSVWMGAFNKEIADALLGRVPPGTRTSTFHSFAFGAASRSLGRLKVDRDRMYHVLDDYFESRGIECSGEWAGALCKTVSLCKSTLAWTETDVDLLLDTYSIAVPYKTKEESTRQLERQHFCEQAAKLLELAKVVKGEVDFDDMIWLPVALDLPLPQFDRAVIDETQDLNPCQLELMQRAVKPDGRITAIGDRRQSIYAFRGADARAIDNIIEKLGAKVLPLSISYRCPRLVVELAQTLVPQIEAAPGAPDGVVEDQEPEDMWERLQPGDFVISRVNAPLVSLCWRLLAAGRPAHIQGRDIGTKLASFVEKSDCKSVDELRAYVDRWHAAECRRLQSKKPARPTDNVDDQAECLLALSDGVKTIRDLLKKIDALFSDRKGEPKIILTSTHKAKGLEADRVWMLEDTYMKREGVEEINLKYVAITRSKRELYLVNGFNKWRRQS
jgi:DNA helicase-2/ATP-dependent DNA helicase PcrA